MRGQILSFDPVRGEGLISGEDGNRYTFAGSEWKSPPHQLQNGAYTDFSPAGPNAVGVFATGAPAPGGYAGGFSGPNPGAGPYPGPPYPGPYASDQKSPIVAGLLAIFLGAFGVHKFYLGYNTEGVILLVGWFVSLLLTLLLIGILGLFAIGIITFIEGIIYITKSQEQFTYTYVVNRRPWF